MQCKRLSFLALLTAVSIGFYQCGKDTSALQMAVQSVSLSPDTANMKIGDTLAIQAKIIPSDAHSDIMWTSNNPNIVSVTPEEDVLSAAIIARAEGRAIISAISKNGIKGIANITVAADGSTITSITSPTGISISASPSIGSVEVSKTIRLKAVVIPSSEGNRNIFWTSSDTNIASVDANGNVRGKSVGEVTITVTLEGIHIQATSAIAVIPSKDGASTNPSPSPTVAVTSISVSPKFDSVEVFKTTSLQVSFNPSNASNKNASWSSSDENIASVDANGIVSGKSIGQATIIVTSEDGQKTDTAFIKVIPSTEDPTKIAYNSSIRSNDGRIHKYFVIRELLTWTEAARYAANYGGYLMEINEPTEASLIEGIWAENVYKNIHDRVPPIPDGGDARYLWIGATDIREEGTWVWDGDNDGKNTTLIGTGQGQAGDGTWRAASFNLFSSLEPDDFRSNQDGGAIALDNWPNGTKGEWNDIDINNRTFFIIEIEEK